MKTAFGEVNEVTSSVVAADVPRARAKANAEPTGEELATEEPSPEAAKAALAQQSQQEKANG